MEPDEMSAPGALNVANVIEAAALLAAEKGLDVIGARSITFEFADNGDVAVSVPDAEPVTIAAADIAAKADTDEDRESIPPSAP